jgi:hypothetical protein
MSTCNKCGKATTLLSTLCNDCKKEQKELEMEEIRLRKEEQKQIITEDIKAIISAIIKEVTDEVPLKYLFFNTSMTAKENNSGTIGAMIGGALGGIGGAAMGSVFSTKPTTYSGLLGILILTENKIIVQCVNSDFYSKSGDICIDHLKFFIHQIGLSKAQEIIFDIDKSLISDSAYFEIMDSKYNLQCRQSKLYIDEDSIFNLTEINELVRLCNELGCGGEIITPEKFILGLISKTNPINEQQFGICKEFPFFFKDLYKLIQGHENRNSLVENFIFLLPSIRLAIKDKVLEIAVKEFRSSLPTVIILFVIMLSGVLGLYYWMGLIFPTYFFGGVILIILGIPFVQSLISLLKANWWIKAIKKYLI